MVNLFKSRSVYGKVNTTTRCSLPYSKQFPKYDMKILLGDFNAKLGTEDAFKQRTENERLRGDGSDDSFRIVNFATSKLGRSCSMYVREDGCIQGFGGKT
jgi:hypothetical protein